MHGRWERQVLAENFRLLETESWRQAGGRWCFEEWDPDAWPLGTTSPGGEFPSLGDGELEASWW